MKELSIEQKAKAYDEAIERVENIRTGKCETTFMFTEGLFEHIFPELAESEDEKVRKAILEMIHDTTGDSLWVDYNVHKEDAIAWLEKQGEQKPAEWSEEDEDIENSLENIVCQSVQNIGTVCKVRYLDWLKSLKDRVQPQNRWKPSGEQMEALDKVVDRYFGNSLSQKDDYNFYVLKKLKEQLKAL